MTGGGQHISETVVFGGALIKHFGHAILECLSRLWFVAESGATERIAFLPLDDTDLPSLKKLYSGFFELLGIDLARIIYIEEPTQFDRVIVPDETVHSQSEYKEKYAALYEKMMSRVEAKGAKKIYLTRSRLANSGSCLNEEYFEEFYKRRGFKVIAPERLKLEDQIAYMKGADEVACTMGTLSHMTLFSRAGTRQTVLVRGEESSPLTEQMMICQVKNLDFYVVNVSCGFLPTTHHLRPFLLGPSKYWREYLDATGEKYAKEELEWDKNRRAYEYLQKWCETASTYGGWKQLSSFDNFDFLNSLSTVLLDAPLRREDYPGAFKEREAVLAADNERLKAAIADPTPARFESEIEALQSEIKVLKSEVRRLECKLQSMENSLAWKISGPLKKVWSLLDERAQNKIREMLYKRLKRG